MHFKNDMSFTEDFDKNVDHNKISSYQIASISKKKILIQIFSLY